VRRQRQPHSDVAILPDKASIGAPGYCPGIGFGRGEPTCSPEIFWQFAILRPCSNRVSWLLRFENYAAAQNKSEQPLDCSLDTPQMARREYPPCYPAAVRSPRTGRPRPLRDQLGCPTVGNYPLSVPMRPLADCSCRGKLTPQLVPQP
jgi:hypothetical protein